MVKNNSEHTFIFPEIGTCKSTLSDIAEVKPTYTVGPWFWHRHGLPADSNCSRVALPITFFCLQSIQAFFSKLGPYNTKIISIPTPF